MVVVAMIGYESTSPLVVHSFLRAFGFWQLFDVLCGWCVVVLLCGVFHVGWLCLPRVR